MTGFTLDTSGVVIARIIGGDGVAPSGQRTAPIEAPFRWPDLSPFEQGTLNQMKRDVPIVYGRDRYGQPVHLDWGFSDLAPETLAAIRKDVQRFRDVRNHTSDGGVFYQDRQAGRYPDFPPRTLTLGDDGKVRFAA